MITDPNLAEQHIHTALQAVLAALGAMGVTSGPPVPVEALEAALGAREDYLAATAETRVALDRLRGVLAPDQVGLLLDLEVEMREEAVIATDVAYRLGLAVGRAGRVLP